MARSLRRKYSTYLEGRAEHGHNADPVIFGGTIVRSKNGNGESHSHRQADSAIRPLRKSSGNLRLSEQNNDQVRPNARSSGRVQPHRHGNSDGKPAYSSKDELRGLGLNLTLPVDTSGRRSQQQARRATQVRSSSESHSVGRTHQSMKRKAVDDLDDAPLAQRLRADKDGPFMDEDYIRRTYSYPTKREYPSAPQSLFGSQVVSALHNVRNNALKLSQQFTALHLNCFRCTVKGTLLDGTPESAVGDGRDKVNRPCCNESPEY